MDKDRKVLIAGMVSLVAIVVLVVANLAWGFSQKQKRLIAAQTPLISQQEMDEAAAIVAAKKEKARQEAFANIKPITPRPTPTATPMSEAPKETAPPAVGDDIAAEQPEYIKPTPPPTPTPVPSPKPGEVQPTPTPTPNQPASKPQYGDRRTNSDGMLEIYIDGFGWVTDSGEPNVTIPGHNSGTGEIIGY